MWKCFARYCIAAAAIAVALLGGAVPGAQAQDTLKFGVADPLTGPSALFGLDQMQAVRWAVEDINANGGINPHRNAIFCIVVWTAALVSVAAIRWLVSGDYGRAITAMRNDEDAFAALGRSALRIRVTLFAIGSGLAGLAGGLYAHFFLYLTPEQFGIFTSATLLTMVVVGGAATIRGPIFGAVLLTVLPEAIRFLDLPVVVMAPLQGVIFTFLIMLFLILRPQGLLGGRGGGGLEAWGRAAQGETALPREPAR
jgi:ABC-type branched-subunit amino acid transport system permease subunit